MGIFRSLRFVGLATFERRRVSEALGGRPSSALFSIGRWAVFAIFSTEGTCCHVPSARRSPRRCSQRLQPALLRPLAVLDLSEPLERQTYEFLCRATSKRERMWTLYSLRWQSEVLLCVVCWAHPESAAQTLALAEVRLTESAVCWQYYARVDVARAEMERRSAEPVSDDMVAPASPR